MSFLLLKYFLKVGLVERENTNVTFSDCIPKLEEKTLNSQWDTTHFHETHNQKKEVFLKFFSDSLAGSCLFPADVLLMSHGLQLSIPYWKAFCLFSLLPVPNSTQLCHCRFAILSYCCWPDIDWSTFIIVSHWQHVSHPVSLLKELGISTALLGWLDPVRSLTQGQPKPIGWFTAHKIFWCGKSFQTRISGLSSLLLRVRFKKHWENGAVCSESCSKYVKERGLEVQRGHGEPRASWSWEEAESVGTPVLEEKIVSEGRKTSW